MTDDNARDNPTGTNTVRVFLDAAGPKQHRERSPGYTARLGSPGGPVIVENDPTPLLSAARVLMQQGVRGLIELWDTERPCPRMSGRIEELAKLAVRESRKDGPEFVRWKPFAGVAGAPRTAGSISPVLLRPQRETAAGELTVTEGAEE